MIHKKNYTHQIQPNCYNTVKESNKNYHKEKRYLLFYSVILLLLNMYINNDSLYLILILPIVLLSIKRASLSFYALVISLPVISSKGGPFIIVLMVIVVVIFLWSLITAKNTVTKLDTMSILVFSIIASVSLLFGQDTDIVSYGWFIISLTIFIVSRAYTNRDGPQLLVHSLFLSAFILIVTILLNSSTQNFLLHGRLSIYGNIRLLANSIVIPLLFATNNLIEKNVNESHKTLEWVIFAVLLMALIMTVSRGAIIAYFFGASIIMVFSKNKGRIKLFLIPLVIYFIVQIILKQSIISTSILLNITNVESMQGRENIWSFYMSELFSGNIIRILFGFGPGELYRVSGGVMNPGAYAHSVYLDFLFTYGVIGFTTFAIALIAIAKKIIKTRNVFIIAIFSTTIFLYSTHGSTTSREFYILISLAICLAENKLRDNFFLN